MNERGREGEHGGWEEGGKRGREGRGEAEWEGHRRGGRGIKAEEEGSAPRRPPISNVNYIIHRSGRNQVLIRFRPARPAGARLCAVGESDCETRRTEAIALNSFVLLLFIISGNQWNNGLL